MRMNHGVAAAVVAAAMVCGLIGGCASTSQPASIVQATQDTQAAHSTAVAAAKGGCGPAAGAEIVRVSSMAEKSGEYRIQGVTQKLECGPNVPDDVQFSDDGPTKSFEVSNSAKYVMPGSDPTRQIAMSAAAFARVVNTKSGSDGGVYYGGICELDLGADGRVVKVTEDYIP